MPLSEYDTKEALRAATDWLVASELPGSAAAREGVADTIPLVMMGLVEPDDLDDLAAIVEERGRAVQDAATPQDVQRARLQGSDAGLVRTSPMKSSIGGQCQTKELLDPTTQSGANRDFPKLGELPRIARLSGRTFVSKSGRTE
jgi:hypothetical protein